MYEKVLKLCKERGIPIYELEKRAGLGNGVIAGWKESSPTLASLEKVAKALGIKVSDLLDA